MVERDPKTGKVTRLVETGYTWFRPPEVKTAHQQAYLRFSTDGRRSWGPSSKVPQWTGYRCQDIVKGQPAPRDVGLVRWRLNSGAVNAETKLRDAAFDSDLRNVYDPNRP